MVLTDEVNPVNHRYRGLSNRYKAGWTFHRFILGLRKFFGGRQLDDRTADFRKLYQGLREVSLRLNSLDMKPVVEELSQIARHLDGLFETLDEQDAKVTPSLVRLFFQRVKTQDERILIDLVRFYIEVQRERDWHPERVDKVDFLLSRLGKRITGSKSGGDSGRLDRVLGGISGYVESTVPFDQQRVENRLKLIGAVEARLEQVASFDELTRSDLVAHYRKVKHGLGAMIFEKSVLPAIVKTNLAAAERVTELTDRAQAKIFENYERVSSLEDQGLIGQDLAESVSRLHGQVGSFKRQVDSGTLRIDAIAQIRSSVDVIVQRIRLGESAEAGGSIEFDEASAAADILQTPSERALLGGRLAALIAASRDSPVASTASAGGPSRQLGEREIEALRRLATAGDRDVELERFLVAAACLRILLAELGEGARRSSADETGAAASAAASSDIEGFLRLGDLYLRRFDHFLEFRFGERGDAEFDGVRSAKMALMREYSGLWLAVRGNQAPV